MKKISQWIFGFAALSILGMLYWSFSLMENDLKAIRVELQDLKSEASDLIEKIDKGSTSTVSFDRIYLDEHLPNLLSEDPYVAETLPKLLGSDFVPRGILKEAMIGRPANLHPFNGFHDIAKMIEMCVVHVANLHFGRYEIFGPDMAIKMEAKQRTDIPELCEYWIHLRDDVYWSPLRTAHFPKTVALASHFFDRHPVTAHDFKFFYDAVMNPYVSESKAAALKTYYNDIETFSVIDDYTFVVRWKGHLKENGYKNKYSAFNLTCALQPLPCFVYQYFADGTKIIDNEENDPDIYRKSSIWAQNFATHFANQIIVSCGPYHFDGMNDEKIQFKRNTNHYNRHAVLVEGAEFCFKESFDALWQQFKAGEIDLCTLSPNQVVEFERFLKSDEYKAQEADGQKIQTLEYIDQSYFYVGWNLANPLFANKEIRHALTLAIDRQRIIDQNLNGMAVSLTGPFFPYSPSYDPKVPDTPFNFEEANLLLEGEGWIDADGDGIREKNLEGVPTKFQFKLNYFVKSLSGKVIADYISTALKQIGVVCQPCGLDLADLSRQFDDKSFDALFMGWKLGVPPEDPRQLWHSSGAKEKGSSNAIGFAHPRIDLLIETLCYESDKNKRLRAYHEFHKIIHDEMPYTFLYTPKAKLLYRERVQNLFIPRERQDLVPSAESAEPSSQFIWLKT